VETDVVRPIRLCGLEFKTWAGEGSTLGTYRVILKLYCCPDLEMCADWCRYGANAKAVYFFASGDGRS
jgi:hypothetical protein